MHTGVKSFGCEKRMAHALHRYRCARRWSFEEDRSRDVGRFRLVRLRSAEERSPLNVRVPVDGAMCRIGREVDEVVAEVGRCVRAGEWVARVWKTGTVRYGMHPSLCCAGRQWGAWERKTGPARFGTHPLQRDARERAGLAHLYLLEE